MQKRDSKLVIKIAFLMIGILMYYELFASCGKVITQTNYSEALTIEGQRYIVKSTIDLGGATLEFPKDATLEFRNKGRLVNGKLKGNNTRIKKPRANSLGVLCAGTWIIRDIKDLFFDWNLLTDNQILDNISMLQSDVVENRIYLNKPKYEVILDKQHKQGLKLRSNTSLVSNTIITVAGNDLPQYSIISMGKENINIEGGTIVGDVGNHTYIEGTTSQWGFGICLSGSSNVTISNVTISKCTGDGIYVGGGEGSYLGDYSKASKNVVIRNVLSDDNRRQGISITYADGVTIENSVFSNTGRTEFVSPGCGMDIEPNAGQCVRNVVLKKCQFLHNDKILDVSIGGYKAEGERCNVEKILIEDCQVTGILSIRTGSVILRRCTMATLSLHLAKMPKEKVFINHCQVKDGSGITIRSVGMTSDSEYLPVYSFKSCVLETNQELTRAMISTINHKGNEVAEFILEDCYIDLPSGTSNFGIVQDNNNCSFKFSNCKINPNGRPIELKESRYINCRLITE